MKADDQAHVITYFNFKSEIYLQVHFLVRENILAIDELRDIHDKIYEEIHECFGLERCRKQENFIDGPPPRNIFLEIFFYKLGKNIPNYFFQMDKISEQELC